MARNALVISGGGSKGAFAVGALRHLIEHEGLAFDIIAGTSTGAAIAPLVVAGALDDLEHEYTNVQTADILEEFPINKVFQTGSVFGVQPLFNRIKRQIDDARFARIAAAPVQMFLCAICLQDARITYFHTGPDAVCDQDSDLRRLHTIDDLRLAMTASSDQPVLMPPIEVPRGAQRQYVDGGVREYAPLQIAIDNGATDVYAILLSPRAKQPQTHMFSGLVDVLMRTIDILTEDVGYNDVRTAEVCTQTVRYMATVRQRVQAKWGASDADMAQLFDDPRVPNPFSDKRVVNLHVIRPAAPLPTEGLDFDKAIMTQLVALGRTAASNIEPAAALLA